MLSGAMLLDDVGASDVADLIRRAVDDTLSMDTMTMDLSPNGVSTSAFTDRVCEVIAHTNIQPSII